MGVFAVRDDYYLAIFKLPTAEEHVVMWAPDGFHAEWVDRRFGQPLQCVCQALGYRGYRQIWEARMR